MGGTQGRGYAREAAEGRPKGSGGGGEHRGWRRGGTAAAASKLGTGS